MISFWASRERAAAEIAEPTRVRPRRGWTTALGVVAALLVATAIMELLVRLLFIGPSIALSHPTLGYIPAPHAIYSTALEGRSTLLTNSLGLNDIDPAPGAHGILVLGDSYVEGYQVDPSLNLVALFRARHPDQTILNAGRGGMHPILFKLMADYVAPSFRPDEFVLVVNSSDLREMRQSRFTIERDAAGRITAITGRELPPKSLAVDLSRAVARHSAIANYLLRKYSDALPASLQDAMRHLGLAARHRPPPTGASAPLDEVMDFLIREFQQQAPVRMMYVPNLTYESGGRTVELPLSVEAGAFFAEAARRTGIPFVNIGPELEQAFRATGQPPCGFPNANPNQGHPNELGHRVMEEALEGLLGETDAAGRS